MPSSPKNSRPCKPTSIDRNSPSNRPNGKATGFQQWRDLLFLHWQVDASQIQATLPDGLNVDCFDGKAYVGVVPFAMRDVRPWRRTPRWAAFNFLECNVRTYVVHNGQPGVYFFSLDAVSRIAVWAARTFWSLPYHTASMEMQRENANGETVDYRSTRLKNGASLATTYRIGRGLGVSVPGSIEHFLLERYLLFVSRRNQLKVGQVHHVPYPVHAVQNLKCHDELAAAAGFTGLDAKPDLAHYSPGVDVEILALRNVDAARAKGNPLSESLVN